MKHKILDILREKNIDKGKCNVDQLYEAGMKNIMENIEFYFDKPYSCESVIKELFIRGVISEIKKESLI